MTGIPCIPEYPGIQVLRYFCDGMLLLCNGHFLQQSGYQPDAVIAKRTTVPASNTAVTNCRLPGTLSMASFVRIQCFVVVLFTSANVKSGNNK